MCDVAARLELDSWIIHRERAAHPRDDLDSNLAALQAELYHVPQGRLAEHAKLRAEAMLLRDRGAENGGPTAEQWIEIQRLLRLSWRSLWEAVRMGATTGLTGTAGAPLRCHHL